MTTPNEVAGQIDSVIKLYRFETEGDRKRAAEAIALYVQRHGKRLSPTEAPEPLVERVEGLARLKAQRDALSAEIVLIERGVTRAAYDAAMSKQLVTINDQRTAEGKPLLSMGRFLSGVETEDS